MNVSAMILASALIGLLGYLYCSFPLNKIPALVATIFAMTMIMSRGYYWTVFERGEGFFTANRVSAFVVLALCWIGGSIYGYISWRQKERFARWIEMDEAKRPDFVKVRKP